MSVPPKFPKVRITNGSLRISGRMPRKPSGPLKARLRTLSSIPDSLMVQYRKDRGENRTDCENAARIAQSTLAERLSSVRPIRPRCNSEKITAKTRGSRRKQDGCQNAVRIARSLPAARMLTMRFPCQKRRRLLGRRASNRMAAGPALNRDWRLGAAARHPARLNWHPQPGPARPPRGDRNAPSWGP